MGEQYDGQQLVGVDLHRRRSVFVRMTPDGQQLGTSRVDNDPLTFAEEIGKAGPAPRVVVEATYGWYWAVDLLEGLGAEVHLAHPLGVKGFAYRRVKNDQRDAADLADLLRMGRLPEAYIAPPDVRELRELVRHRAKLVAWRTAAKEIVHATLAKCGVLPQIGDLFGPGGARLLDQLRLEEPYAVRLASLRRLIGVLDTEVDAVTGLITGRLSDHSGYRAIQVIHGVGPILAAVFVAEIGEVTRFPGPPQLCSWAGLTPRHRESDTSVHRGPITKQGSALLRWAAIEAVQRTHEPVLARQRARVGTRRGPNTGKVAAARLLLALVYYGLRDGEIRRLARPAA